MPSMPRCHEIPKSEIQVRFTSNWKPASPVVEGGEQPERDGAGAGGEQQGHQPVQLDRGPSGSAPRPRRR